MSKLTVSRREFLAASAGATAVTGLFSTVDSPAHAQSGPTGTGPPNKSVNDAFPRQSPRLVQETVGASHARFERVRELVTAYPELAKSSWDWGFGDWEAPIDAASHTGQREIALFLMEYGARPTLFTYAMLGELNVVKTVLESQPELRKTGGPHGFSLLHHARVGGERAAAVREFLEKLGGADESSAAPSKEIADAIIGRYAADGTNGPRFEVALNKQKLVVMGEDGMPRNLFQLPDASLHPAGAPSVRFRFEIVDGRANSVSMKMGADTVQAVRLQ